MLVCIPTQGNAGVDDKVNEHFGSAPFFTLYDSTNSEIKILENRNSQHSHGTCHPMNQLTRYHVDCIVCSGMGRRAIEALNTEGIKIYQADSERVGDVIESVKSQKLIEIDPAKACQGQGQRGGCAHGTSAPGQGRGAGFGLGPGRGQGRRDR